MVGVRMVRPMPDHPYAYVIGLLAAVCIGMSKAGFSGVSLVAVFLLADLYGAKESVGLALPLLIAADLIVYPAFRAHGSWRPVWRLLLPTLVGIGLGWLLLGAMTDAQARRVIGVLILALVGVQVAVRSGWKALDHWCQTSGFAVGSGVLGGFATMTANAAGPVIQLYLLARRVPKMDLIGTSARFFLLVNLLKIPINAKLALITSGSLLENLRLMPGVIVGIFGGKWLVRHVPQRAFGWLIVGFAVVAGVRLAWF